MTNALALKDVCRLLGVQPYRIQHAYAVGAVPEPHLRVSGRRVFTASDVDMLRKHFSSKSPATATEPAAAGI